MLHVLQVWIVLGVHGIHLVMLQDRPEENGNRTSAGARLYLQTADVIEALQT